MKKEKEFWKDIPNYEGVYQCSNLGRVKSLKRYRVPKDIILKRVINSYGYYLVTLFYNGNGKTYKVHKLIAITFLNHIPNGFIDVVDHIDGNKENNSVDNLRIVTSRFNSSIGFRKDRKYLKSKYTGVSFNKKNNNWVSYIFANKKYRHLGCFKTEIEAYNKYLIALKRHENNPEYFQ